MKKTFVRSTIISVIAFFVPSVSFSGGSAIKNPNQRYENVERFQKVLTFIENNYVEEVDNQKLMEGAIQGMFNTLDPHSSFLTTEVYRDMKIDTAGKFGGLGIELGMKDNVLTILSPIEGTPAWRAGLKANDRIVKINGESTKGLNLTEAVAKMRGKASSSIKLGIFRSGFEAPKEVVLTREMIKIQSTRFELLDRQYGYVRLTNFNETAAQDVKKAIESLEKGAPSKSLKGLILDLRNNPGGLLDQAVDLASLFIDEGIVVSTIGRDADQKEIRYAKKGKARKEVPLAVLVNSGSASASEIVAGALQDHHRAIVLGQPTFGKGSVQTVVELGNDEGLKLTIARYYTPKGRSIQEKGVIPDVLLDDFDPKALAVARRKSDSLRERDLKGHMRNTDPRNSDEEEIRPDFDLSELQELAGGAAKKDGPSRSPAQVKDDDFTPEVIQPKEDYQVQEAMNYLKSFDVFKRLSSAEMTRDSQKY